MTTHRSKSKLQVEFQYGGSPFSEIESSFISVVEWDISSKFGIQIDFRLVQTLYLNTEVDFQLYGSHLEKSMTS